MRPAGASVGRSSPLAKARGSGADGDELGHAGVATTQIYTQVSIRQLKQIHSATHPAAELLSRLAQVTDGEEEL